MNTSSPSSLYFKNLDASRFFAFLMIFFSHCFLPVSDEINTDWYIKLVDFSKVGFLGLDYFFVLSSFLVSSVILHEYDRTGHFHLRNFLIRRSLRIWPLYFLMIGIAIFASITPSIGAQIQEIPPWPHLFLFLINFYIVEHGNDFLIFLVFLWSIGVEEQFYLIWGSLLRYLRNWIGHISILFVVLSLLFRFFYQDDANNLYYHTVSVLGNFGIGGLLAYGFVKKKEFILKSLSLSKKIKAAIYLALLLSIIGYQFLSLIPYFEVFERLFFAILFAYIILDQSSAKESLFNLEALPIFKYLGKISYGLYCYHGLTITLSIFLLQWFYPNYGLIEAVFFIPIILLVSTVILSHLSYTYFEKIFLEFKKQFYTFRA